MIPDFSKDGFLPAGVHKATLRDLAERFAIFDRSDRRQRLFVQLERLVCEAVTSGIITRFLLGGSFVTEKPEPNDFDCILVVDTAVVGQSLAPHQYNLVSRRDVRRRYGGDIVPVLENSEALEEYLEFFQTNRDGQRVGIVEISL